ncbi:alpha/beta-hydrolase [Aureobasidium namibiae CBS 147.97]|uniref:Cutinase n=1 Tax=Aureobasidium namibiae CBS 147.97 TaxID=1043004 RepID=A0A074WEU8_9PEZI|nr:alpha/beta-hydrolase [Aureobasidium namibiae CBS 147.97]KEQ70069.1 alpha/beta-hydrolase [Aureobasidium namibiae CBS 147.97]
MRVSAPTVALAIAQTSVAASLPQLEARQSACSDVHIFLGKGNNEPYPGRQGKLVNAICNGLENCDYEDILFYNPVEAPYCQSIDEGVANGIAQLNSYHARCPDTKLVISGYSQGAQVVGDIIGGGSGTFFQDCMTTPSPNLDVNSDLGKKIVAVTVFGNTRHTANQPYNQFSGAPDNGIFPRPAYQLANLATWTSKFHDYCVAEDPICAGGDVVADHLNYFDLYSDVAAAWIKSQIASADVVVSSTIVSPSSTFTSVATTDKVVPTTYAYSNNTASASTGVLAIPTVAPESVVTVTVDCASVDTSAIASYTSVWAATAQVTQSVAASATAGSGPATTGSSGSKSSSAPNGTHTLMPYTGAASSISGAVSGSLAVVLLGAFALVL